MDLGDFEQIVVLTGIITGQNKITKNHPDPPRNRTQLIKTHEEQDKSSISFIFKCPTDWGACDSTDSIRTTFSEYTGDRVERCLGPISTLHGLIAADSFCLLRHVMNTLVLGPSIRRCSSRKVFVPDLIPTYY